MTLKKMESLQACDNCDDKFEPGDLYEIDGESFCEECRDELFILCESCDRLKSANESVSTASGSVVCDSCYERYYFTCYHCGDVENQDDSCNTPNDDLCCEPCFSDRYFNCNSCGDCLSLDEISGDGLCPGCANDEESENDDSEIHDASFVPALDFHKEKWENTLYQGIELEIEIPGNKSISDHSRNFKAWLDKEGLGKFLYFKHDGSLNHGYEIVSHPFTSRSRHRLMNWYKILQYLKSTGAKAFKTDSCGLHIHISRQALPNEAIKKLRMFFWNNREQIQRVAGRRGNQYCEYVQYGMGQYKANYVENDSSRYVAVNANRLRSKMTVEFRIFKATLDIKRFLGCMQFTEAISEFVKAHSVALIHKPGSWDLFKQWARANGHYEHLIRHIRKVGA